MQKLTRLLLLTALISLAFASCKSKDKDHSEDDMDSLTLVYGSPHLA